MTEVIAILPALATARLALRPHRPADATRIARLANDFEVVKMTGGMPFPYGLADAEAFVARAGAADLATDVEFAVELPGEGLIGGLGFFTRDEVAPEVGYWLGRPYWGRGYASEMLKGAMAWARSEWGQRCVLACHFVDNPASGHVLGKAGFLHTGRIEPRPCRARGHNVVSRWMVWMA
jgi:RimJ/RimL family protein N-acetyltransferase